MQTFEEDKPVKTIVVNEQETGLRELITYSKLCFFKGFSTGQFVSFY